MVSVETRKGNNQFSNKKKDRTNADLQKRGGIGRYSMYSCLPLHAVLRAVVFPQSGEVVATLLVLIWWRKLNWVELGKYLGRKGECRLKMVWWWSNSEPGLVLHNRLFEGSCHSDILATGHYLRHINHRQRTVGHGVLMTAFQVSNYSLPMVIPQKS